MSPQKARLVLDLIRGQQVDRAMQTLQLTRKRAAKEIEKCLRSAIANATQKTENLDVDNLVVARCWVNEGPRWKRIRSAPFGRAYRYQRRTSHITIYVVGEEEQPRPSAAGPKAPAKPTRPAAAKGEAAKPQARKRESGKPESGKPRGVKGKSEKED
jgi:large subunit ribosomal protein L22